MSHANNNKVCWLSVDPVRRKVDYYSKEMAAKLDKAYLEKSRWEPTPCILGADWFNATVWFHNRGFCYQTTPGCNMGRFGYKRGGFRSVKRVLVPDDRKIVVDVGLVNGEMRIVLNDFEVTHNFQETIPENVVIDSTVDYDFSADLAIWKPEELDNESGLIDKSVVVWEWCNDMHPDTLLMLRDDIWMPYLYDQAIAIERSFKDGVDEVKIIVPFDNTQRTIKFVKNNANDTSCYAQQIRYDAAGKSVGIRRVRRRIISLGDLVKKFAYHTLTANAEYLLSYLAINQTSIPHNFICCISQDIMKDPVKTIDGQIYDRAMIERWFQMNDTSPLTGLHLNCKTLVPDTNLLNEINTFLELSKE